MNIEQAKRIPIEDALAQLGLKPSRSRGNATWYLSPLRAESTPSFKVNRDLNLWYDFGDGNGGDIIDLIQGIFRLGSVSETLAQLEDIMGQSPPRARHHSSEPRAAIAPAIEVTGNLPIRSRSLLAYLEKRGIDIDIARTYVREIHYRVAGKNYFALGFPTDSDGLELRNPYFKGTYGRKDITTLQGSQDRVWVFEGFFDFLTAKSIFKDHLDGTVVVLNSVAMSGKAARFIRETKPGVVELYRDRDSGGESLLSFFQQELPEPTIVDWSGLYAEHGDLNAWHVATQQKRFPSR